MPSNTESFPRNLFPTAHRLLLNQLILQELKHARGDVLVVGAGHYPYKSTLANASSVLTTDITNHTMIDEVADAHNLPYEDKVFDIILALEVMEHLHSPAIATKEFHRCLRKGGTLILSVPFMFHIHADPYDYQRLTKQGFLNLLSDFSLIEVKEIGGRFAVISDIITNQYLQKIIIFSSGC